MATRANIIVQTGPQEFSVIYTHSDGYPSYMGVYLNRFHNSDMAAREIVSYGACSFIDARLAPEVGELHHFDSEKRAPFCSVFYTRDRGEELSVQTADSLGAALALADNEWVYVWLTGVDGWLFSDVQIREPNEQGGEWIVTTAETDLSSVAVFLPRDTLCQERITELDKAGMTVEWRDAGCPYSPYQGKYGPDPQAVPLNADGSIPATFDHGVQQPGTEWETDIGVLPVRIVGAATVSEPKAPAPVAKKRKVATKAEKKGFAYGAGAWA